MTRYKVDDVGWLAKAMDDINAGRAVDMVVNGPAAFGIVRSIQSTVQKMPVMDLWKTVVKIIPTAGTFHLDPTQVMPVLACIGAVGGAAGAVAFVGSVGVAHGYGLSFVINLGVPWDPTDDEVVICLTSKATK